MPVDAFCYVFRPLAPLLGVRLNSDANLSAIEAVTPFVKVQQNGSLSCCFTLTTGFPSATVITRMHPLSRLEVKDVFFFQTAQLIDTYSDCK